YKENYYGYLQDKLNKDLPTDRIIIEWNLDEEKVEREVEINEDNLLITVNENGLPNVTNQFDELDQTDRSYWVVTIPSDFQQMKKTNKDLARTWRFTTRKLFQQLF